MKILRKKTTAILLIAVLMLLVSPLGQVVYAQEPGGDGTSGDGTSDETQSVTGTTLSAYTVIMSVGFGDMIPSSTQEHTGIITVTYDANIDVTVGNTLDGYVAGRITSLEYFVGAESKCLITAPVDDGFGGIYTVTGSPFSVTSGQTLDLTATAGMVAGVWDPVVITLTISPP